MPDAQRRLERQAVTLESLTLAWNVAGVALLAVLALAARSVALAGFGLDSLVEIGASTLVLWELRGVHRERERRALTLIGVSFVLIAAYLAVQSIVTLVARDRPHHSPGGIAWTGATALVMFALAWGKGRVGVRLGRNVLIHESRVTFVDGLLAVAILIGLSLNALAGWWWADPAATFVIVGYGVREAREVMRARRRFGP